MLDYLMLGPTPTNEDCAQVGSPDFEKKANKQLDAYKAQLERMFPGWETHKNLKFKKMFTILLSDILAKRMSDYR
jgi:hypothetical protein